MTDVPPPMTMAIAVDPDTGDAYIVWTPGGGPTVYSPAFPSVEAARAALDQFMATIRDRAADSGYRMTFERVRLNDENAGDQ